MLDQYKSAVIKDRESRKKADVFMKKNGHVSMLATSMAQDYDRLPVDLGDGARVAHLSVAVEEMKAQLKGVGDATAAEAAAAASRVQKEEEDKHLEDACRDILRHFSGDKESAEDQDTFLAGYMIP